MSARAALVALALATSMGCQARPTEVQSEPQSQPARAPAEATAAEQAPPPATESGFESIVLSEAADPAWASQKEASLQQAFNSPGSPKLLSVVCRTTLCKLVIEAGDAEPPMNLPRAAVANSAIAFYRRNDVTIVYVSRSGHGLPTAPGVAAKTTTTVNGAPVDN